MKKDLTKKCNWIKSNEESTAVKLGDKEHFDKEQIGAKDFSMYYQLKDDQPFYTINLLLDKETWR